MPCSRTLKVLKGSWGSTVKDRGGCNTADSDLSDSYLADAVGTFIGRFDVDGVEGQVSVIASSAAAGIPLTDGCQCCLEWRQLQLHSPPEEEFAGLRRMTEMTTAVGRDGFPAYTLHQWAKSDRSEPGRIHLLEHHLADVGACFEALLGQPTIRKRLARTGGREDLDRATVSRLSVLAALHDIGKVNMGFQTQSLAA